MAKSSQGIYIAIDDAGPAGDVDVTEIVTVSIDGIQCDTVEVTPRSHTGRNKSFSPADTDYGTASIVMRSQNYITEAAVGEPVIFTKNDPDLDLQNGSMGRVIAVDETGQVLSVQWDDGVVRDLTGPALYNCDLAHGITTHKSQGSQYERVVIVVPRASKILDRTLLYTAVTRAKQQAVLVGDRAAITAAVNSPSNPARRLVPFLSHNLSQKTNPEGSGP